MFNRIEWAIGLLIFFWLAACSSRQSQEHLRLEVIQDTTIKSTLRSESPDDQPPEEPMVDCFQTDLIFNPSDSVRANYIDGILNEDSSLAGTNRELLIALRDQNQVSLAIRNVLFPIFKPNEAEIGVLAFPQYYVHEEGVDDEATEASLVEQAQSGNDITIDQFGKTSFYPSVLDSVYANEEKPVIQYYTASDSGMAQIADLGANIGECSEYYIYSFDTTYQSLKDSILFGSSLSLDLRFEGDREIDSLISIEPDLNCIDCPNSFHQARTFAYLVSDSRIYFVYADTFPVNDKLDTPLRGLVYVTEDKKAVYLWQESMDLFGCSCL